MAEYLDEKIIELQRAEKRETHQDIYGESVFVGVEELNFSEMELFDKNLLVMLPESFVEMPADVAQVKYPSEQRPQIIWSNETGTVNFCFSLFEMEMVPEQVDEAVTGFRSMLQRMQPGTEFFDFGIETVDKNKIGWFDFKNSAIDEQIYSILFVTPIHGRVCNGVFNCLFRDYEDWKPIMKQVLLSMKSAERKEL